MSLSADVVRAVTSRLSPAAAALVGLGLVGGSVLAVVATESWLLGSLLTPVCAVGVVLVLLSAFRGAASAFGEKAARAGAWTLAVAGMVTAAFGFASMRYNRGTNIACSDAVGRSWRAPDSLELRQAALAEGERRIASWWSLAPRWFGELPVECRWAREDLERQRRGLCPREPIEGVACSCGGRSWPSDTGCAKKPSCPFDNPQRAESFNCWRD